MTDHLPFFICPAAARNAYPVPGSVEATGRLEWGYPDGHNVIVRTGRVRASAVRSRGPRLLDDEHEFRCECGHVGWTRHRDILDRPLG